MKKQVGKKDNSFIELIFLLVVMLIIGAIAVRDGFSIAKRTSGMPLALMAEEAENSINGTEEEEKAAEPIEAKTKMLPVVIDTSQWKIYTNKAYGFEISYPADWPEPKEEKRGSDDTWERRYLFAAEQGAEDEGGSFHVSVYNKKTAKEIPGVHSSGEDSSETSRDIPCSDIDGKCFIPPSMFVFEREEYIYILEAVSEAGESISESGAPGPLLLALAIGFHQIEIVKPKVKAPSDPKLKVPRPISAKRVGGKYVCAKEKDKPRESKKTKEKHLDMQCCLDPDEYPNPWCTY